LFTRARGLTAAGLFLFSIYRIGTTFTKELTMPRELTSHKVNGLNDATTITVLDEPGAGGACHKYEVAVTREIDSRVLTYHGSINFQNGPILEAGFNGIGNEALLAILEDRLMGFQSGPYASRENAIALTKIQEAMLWLHKRTTDRVRRGVEGTHEK